MGGMFNGVSHAVIFFNTVAGAKQSGVSAMMKVCFGSDDDAIAQVLYSTAPGTKAPAWTLPVRTTGIAPTSFPVFTGKVGEEVLALVGRAADRFKKNQPTGVLAGRSFRVTVKGVEEIKPEIKPETPAK
jgi:hypothetical protein